MQNDFALIAPEIALVFVVLFQQIMALYFRNYGKIIISLTNVAVIFIAIYLLYYSPNVITFAFSGSFCVSPTLSLFKSLMLGFSVMSVIIYADFKNIEGKPPKQEFVTLVMLSAVGACVTISACDFLLLFCGLELQALAGYALAAFDSKRLKSSEAGLKYFILGALVSCLMLFGISLLYGLSGSIRFFEIQRAFDAGANLGLIIGVVMVLVALLFKLSAAPLHIWTPDVYEGAPIASVTYFSVAQKIGALVVLINFFDLAVGDFTQISIDLMKIVAILSMVTGALGAILQVSLKRLMAYSTILNMGYTLIGVAIGSIDGRYGAYLYMFIYILGNIGFFACLVALFGTKSDEATLEDLKGVGKSRKTLAAAITIIMFSMIGLPPLAGFFAKYYIFYKAIEQGEMGLAIVGVFTSVIAAFYYLKIIKYMYFVETKEDILVIPTNRGLMMISTITVTFTLFFFLFASSYI